MLLLNMKSGFVISSCTNDIGWAVSRQDTFNLSVSQFRSLQILNKHHNSNTKGSQLLPRSWHASAFLTAYSSFLL